MRSSGYGLYIRLPFAALMPASLTWAVLQPDGSVGSLLAAVCAPVRAGRRDGEIASTIRAVKRSEQSADMVVEERQSEGAGPETLEALDRHRELSRTLARPAQGPMLFDAPPPSSAEDQSSSRRFLLPRSVDSRVVMEHSQSRNVMEFGEYRKFSSEATVTFEK